RRNAARRLARAGHAPDAPGRPVVQADRESGRRSDPLAAVVDRAHRAGAGDTAARACARVRLVDLHERQRGAAGARDRCGCVAAGARGGRARNRGRARERERRAGPGAASGRIQRSIAGAARARGALGQARPDRHWRRWPRHARHRARGSRRHRGHGAGLSPRAAAARAGGDRVRAQAREGDRRHQRPGARASVESHAGNAAARAAQEATGRAERACGRNGRQLSVRRACARARADVRRLHRPLPGILVETEPVTPPASAPPPTPRRRGIGSFLVWLVVLALLGAGGWYGWQWGRIELARMHERDQEVASLVAESRQLRAKVDALAQEQSEDLASAKKDIAELKQQMETSGAAISKIAETVQGGRTRVQLAAIEQVLLMANDRALLAHDADGAAQALAQAD